MAARARAARPATPSSSKREPPWSSSSRSRRATSPGVDAEGLRPSPAVARRPVAARAWPRPPPTGSACAPARGTPGRRSSSSAERAVGGVVVELDVGHHRHVAAPARGTSGRTRRPRAPSSSPSPQAAFVPRRAQLAADQEGRARARSRAGRGRSSTRSSSCRACRRPRSRAAGARSRPAARCGAARARRPRGRRRARGCPRGIAVETHELRAGGQRSRRRGRCAARCPPRAAARSRANRRDRSR